MPVFFTGTLGADLERPLGGCAQKQAGYLSSYGVLTGLKQGRLPAELAFHPCLDLNRVAVIQLVSPHATSPEEFGFLTIASTGTRHLSPRLGILSAFDRWDPDRGHD
jgi:hypothetical protein